METIILIVLVVLLVLSRSRTVWGLIQKQYEWSGGS